jgi:hypothetical protein
MGRTIFNDSVSRLSKFFLIHREGAPITSDSDSDISNSDSSGAGGTDCLGKVKRRGENV